MSNLAADPVVVVAPLDAQGGESPPPLFATTLASTWGWDSPPKSVLKIAAEAVRASNTLSAQLLVDWGAVTAEQAKQWLASKPPNHQTFSWFAQQSPAVVPYVERALTLKAGFPYYDALSVLTVHPAMSDPDVLRRADSLDAALMLVEGRHPVVVFSTFVSMINYRSLGRTEQGKDAILKKIGPSRHFLAVGQRDEISAVIKGIRESDPATASMEAANLWLGSAPEHRSHAASREITRLIDHALHVGATDIALKPFRTGEMLVQLRRFGQMISPKTVNARMSPDLGDQVVNLLMSKSGANPTNTLQRLPTDGQITYRSSAGDAFLRLSFIPLNHLGELRHPTSVSARILPRAETSIELAHLHLSEAVIDQLTFAASLSQGLILVVGPTNSGKSTTIAGAIGEHVRLYGDTHKRISIEDPIERFVYGVTQVNAPPAALFKDAEDERFGIILRAIKRHDPDMIWVGEVRDKLTATLCVDAASTGHLVMSTMHANNTVMGFDVLSRTVEADKRFQLVEGLSLIVSQRLVKVLCPECREIAIATDVERNRFEQYLRRVELLGESDATGEAAAPLTLPEKLAHHNRSGCEACGHEGYVGEVPINEVLPFTREVKNAAIEMLSGVNRRQEMARARPVTLLGGSLRLLREHVITLSEMLV